MSPLVLAAAALALLWACTTWCRWLARYLRFRRLEMAIPGPKALPVIGNLLDLAAVGEDDRLSALLSIAGGRTALSRASVGTQLVVFVSDPADVAVVLRDPRFADKPDVYYSFLERVCGPGLLTRSGPFWKRHRAILRPAFHPSVIDEYVPVFAEEAGILAGALRAATADGGQAADGVLDPALLESALTRALTRASIRTIMAADVQEEDRAAIEVVIQELSARLRDVNERMFRPWLWPDATFAMSDMGRKLDNFNRICADYGTRILARIRERLRSGEVDGRVSRDGMSKRRTFAEILAESALPDDEIHTEGKTMFGASVESNVTATKFVLKVLSVKPDIQDRVYDELMSVLGDDKNLTADEINSLPYLDSVIKETLRVLPSFPLVGRQVKAETELAGKQLPADTMVLVNIFGMHRDPRNFPDPLRFDPDRFVEAPSSRPSSVPRGAHARRQPAASSRPPSRGLSASASVESLKVASEAETASSPPPAPLESAHAPDGRHPYSYIPFSAGPRGCIGQRYAMNAIKTTLAAVLRDFRVDPVDDGHLEPAEFPVTFHLALHMVGGVSVRLTPRDQNQDDVFEPLGNAGTPEDGVDEVAFRV